MYTVSAGAAVGRGGAGGAVVVARAVLEHARAVVIDHRLRGRAVGVRHRVVDLAVEHGAVAVRGDGGLAEPSALVVRATVSASVPSGL